MTQGGNKGDHLLSLLKHLELENRYENIVLVDDSQGKVEDMAKALDGKKVTFYGLRYEGIKPLKIPPVTREQLKDARKSWATWQSLMKTTYPERLQRFKECPQPAYSL